MYRCKHICKPLQADPQTKVCKRASTFPTQEKLFFKISFPSKIFKTATAQPTHKDQNTHWTMTAKPLSYLTFTTRTTERQLVTAVLQKWRCSASYDSEVVNQNLVLRLKLSGENRHLRKAAKRWSSSPSSICSIPRLCNPERKLSNSFPLLNCLKNSSLNNSSFLITVEVVS